MKLQYLGDSRDCFKWDYHNYLTSALDYPLLNIALMMTPNDKTTHGKTDSNTYKAHCEAIHGFCRELQESKDKDIEMIKLLPTRTGAKYKVELHKNATQITNNNRIDYFSNITHEAKQVFFLDPDNGFEPEKKFSNKHVLYSDIERILQQTADQTVVSVFQYFRRIPFPDDFMRIRQRLHSGYATAIFGHSLMFVAISKSEKTIINIRSINKEYSETINEEYSENRPLLKVIPCKKGDQASAAR